MILVEPTSIKVVASAKLVPARKVSTVLCNGSIHKSPFCWSGIPQLNSLVANAITSPDGDETGYFIYEKAGTLCYQTIPYIERKYSIEFHMLALRNLDSFGYPLEILHPQDAHTIRSQVVVGANSKPIQAVAAFALDIPDENIVNDFNFAADLSEAGMLFTVLAMIEEQSAMKMPLIDIHDSNCWLAKTKERGDADDTLVGLGLMDLELYFEVVHGTEF